MSVKTQRKAKAAPDSKAGAGKKVRGSAPKTTSKSNGKHPLALYEHLHIGIVEASLRGKYIDANEEFCRILGYSKKELLRLGIRDCTHEDDYALDIKLHEELVAGKIPFYALEERFVRRDGGIIWVELTRSLVRNADGKPICTIGAVIDISERKGVERALRESSESLRLATEAARMFKWELDLQKQLYTFADNFVYVLGFSAGLLPQNSVETVWRLSPPEDVQAISEAIAKAVESHSDLNSLHYRMVNPENGQTVWLEANAKVVYDEAGNARRLFGLAQNITEKKRAEQWEQNSAANLLAAAEANAKFRTFFDQGSYFAGVMTLDGTLVEANRLCLDFCGFRREDVIGKKFWDCGWWNRSPALMEMVRRGTREAAEGKLFRQESTYFVADGSERFVDLIIAPITDEAGRLLFLAPTGTDITERKRMEHALRESEERFRALVSQTTAGMAQSDMDSRLTFVNPRLCEMFGYPESELVGKTIWELTHADDLKENQRLFESMLAGGGSYQFEKRFIRRDGSILWASVSVSTIRDQAGKPIGGVGVIVDISERKRAEQALAEYARQQAALYQLSDRLHHTHSLEDVYNAALDAILGGLQCDRASILLFDVADVMRFVAWRGLSEGYRKATEGHSPWSADEQNPYPICVGDIRNSDLSEALQTVIQEEGIRSLAFIPMLLNGKLIGKLMVYFNTFHDCSDVEIELGLMIARQLAAGIDRKRTEEQLRESAEFDAFRVDLTDALRSLSDPERVLPEAMRVLGEKLQVDRVLYSEIADDDETILILNNYVKEGVPKLSGRGSLNDYGKARGPLSAGQNLVIEDANISPDMDEKDRASFAALGIRSGLAIPFIKSGRWAATLGVHHSSVRIWTQNEIRFMEEAAERTWSALERARAQQKLRASEALYRTIARSIPGGGIYVVDKDFRYLVAEGSVTEAFGLSRESLEGHTVSEVFPDERGTRMEERLRRIFAGETISFETTHSGRVYWTQLAPLLNSIGQAIILTLDITERKQAEEAIRLENERFMRFVNSNIVGILIGDASGKVLLANDYYLHLLGVSRQDFIEGKVDWKKFTPPEWLPADAKAIQELRERGVCEPYEKEYVRTDGTRVPVYIADAMLPGPGDEMAAFVLDMTERKRAEEAQRQSEERFVRFMQHLPGLAWIKDVQGRYVYVNAAAEKAFSTPRERLYGKTDAQIFPAEVAAHFRKNDEQALIGEKGMQTVETLRQDDGILHYSLVSKFPIPGPDGRPALIGGTAFDITERLQAEEALRKSEARYRNLFDLVPVAVYTCDANGLIQEYNQRAVELWGREPNVNDPQEAKYCGSYRLYYPDGRFMPHEECPMNRVLTGEILERSEAEVIIERPDGSRRMVIAHPLPVRDQRGHIIEAINCLYDITERKQALQALYESEERFKAILKQATAGIVRKDAEGRFVFVNQAYCDMLGYTESELIGKSFWQFMHQDDLEENKRLYNRLMMEGIPFKFEKRVIRKDGSLIWLDLSVSPVIDAGGKPQSAVAVEVDITARKRAEEALQQLNLQLESRVQRRTATIQAMNQSLREEIAERKRAEEALRASEATARASEEKLRTLFDLLPVGISFLDPQGQVLQINSALLNILKLTKEQLFSQAYKARKYIRPDGTPMPPSDFASARALSENRIIYNVETGIILETDEVVWTSVSAAPVDVADVGVVVVTVDITESKRAERALQESHGRLRILSQRLVEVQEEERRALARELHDRVGQTLAALNINLIIVNGQLAGEAAREIGARLNDSMKLVAETIALVRDVMTDLRPSVLDDYGLEAALESQVSKFRSRYSIYAILEKPERPIPRLGPSIEMTFLRIAQEALMNIAKHAHAENVNLSLRQDEESVCLIIQDDGIGIGSWQEADRPGSHGLKIMRERAEAFGGSLRVVSAPGQGTNVEVSIPFKNDGKEQAEKEGQL